MAITSAVSETSNWTTEITGRVRRMRGSTLARNTVWMIAGNGVRLLIQAAYFVVIARTLGTFGYGAFVGASALVAFVAPFSSLGFGPLLIRDASRNRALLPEAWGNALAVNLVAGLILMMVIAVVGGTIFRNVIPLPLIMAVAAADLLLCGPLNLATFICQVENRLDWMAQFQALSNGLRLAGACMLAFLFRSPNALSWSYIYAGTTALGSAVAVWWAWPRTGAPRPCWRTIRRDAREGLSFAVSLSAMNTYNDMDKTMLARMATLDAVGIYAAAYRVIDVAFVPVRSLVAAAYADYFRTGARGLQYSYAYAKRLLRVGGIYSLAAAVSLLALAPLVPKILGAEFGRTVEALRWLAFLPLMKTLQYFLGDALTGAGYQSRRMVLQIVAAVLNVAANFLFIARWSWRGAAWTSLMADGFLSIALWVLVRYLLRAQKESVRNVAATAR